MSQTIVLRGVQPYGEAAADLVIRDGVIAEVAPAGTGSGERVLEARQGDQAGGLVDLHTHLREPGREDAETVDTGSQAAALGGYTAVFAMANTFPVADTAGVVEPGGSTGPRSTLRKVTGVCAAGRCPDGVERWVASAVD